LMNFTNVNRMLKILAKKKRKKKTQKMPLKISNKNTKRTIAVTMMLR
jgi:hypothetical protein